jgi:hypothetical protein
MPEHEGIFFLGLFSSKDFATQGSAAMKSLLHLTFFLVLLLTPIAVYGEKRDSVQFGRDIVVEAGDEIGDAVCFGCSIRVHGALNGDAVALWGNIEISATVAGDAVAIGGDIRLTQGATVGGDAVAVAGKVERDAEANLGGESVSLPGLGKYILLGLLAMATCNILLVALGYLIMGGQRVGVLASTVREHAGLSLLTGIGVMIATVVLLVIASMVGPLTPILVVAIALAGLVTLLIGYTGMSCRLGKTLTQGSDTLGAACLGALLITLLQFVPFLGVLFGLIFALLAAGSAALSGYGKAPDWLANQFATRQPVPPPSRPRGTN